MPLKSFIESTPGQESNSSDVEVESAVIIVTRSHGAPQHVIDKVARILDDIGVAFARALRDEMPDDDIVVMYQVGTNDPVVAVDHRGLRGRL